ncbi:MAG TPA: phosphatase PAP2 family protein [Verrucomicrobiae bacterium]|nr:phosphatase PAP2 family protein [Verrucomicrobiae bacterium]
MRAAEWIHVIVFSFLVTLAWLRPLAGRRRLKVTAIGIAALAATLASAYVLPRLLAPLPASVVRDWLPASLVLLVYWQAGEFFVGPDQPFQDRLERLDERLVGPLLRWIASRRLGAWIAAALELAYVLCYPMIPMSMATLYLLRVARHADYFWTVVLISTYSSYCLLPFLQSLPPRIYKEPWLTPLPHNPIRALNLYLLRHASIHANTFPSAHVAASVAAALVIATLAPWTIGLLFVAIATGIAFGTFAGRYHYAADSITGAAVALLVFLVKVIVSGPPR